MINFRIADLGTALRELRAKGIQIERTVEESFGDFAYLRDPEGNLIELWMEKPSK
jgi:catechol-2,3-dioxygenase